jgi:chromosome segregation ATPase
MSIGREPQESSAPALDLVGLLAETISGVRSQAAALEQRAQCLASDASQKVREADERVSRCEAARLSAERALSEALGCARAAEKECERANSRASTFQVELEETKARLTAAEARAHHAEATLKQLEQAIRNELLGLGISDPYGRGAAA